MTDKERIKELLVGMANSDWCDNAAKRKIRNEILPLIDSLPEKPELTEFERAILRGFLCAGVKDVSITIIKETAKDALAQIQNPAWSEEDSIIRNEIINYFECQSEEEPTIEDVHNRWIAWLANTPWLKNNLPTALSKEEEQILGFIIEDIVDQIDDPGTDDGDRALYNKEAKLLQSLKDRVQSQTKQEWSEDDEAWLNDIINDAEQGAELDSQQINWLKSLRSQNHWKPSEEMLEALYRSIPENTMEKSEDEMLLDKLYQGLKYGRVLSKN